MENVFDVLRERGFLFQCTDEEELSKSLMEKSITLYMGVDATADSLHAGHLVGLMALSWFQKYGHKVILVLGGGTTLIGDPSGKDEIRKMLTIDDIEQNAIKLKKQIEKYIIFENNGNNNIKPAIIVNNYDWLKELNYIEVLREIGPYMSVNVMVSRDSVKQRWEKGLTFLEFNYSILQAYDFLYLNEKYNCELQVGGSDQWGNIISGQELIRKKTKNKSYALTWPLTTTSTGNKMGKTEKGAVWLESELLNPYEYYQYWINTTDADVEKFLLLYTFLPVDEIKNLTKHDGEKLREAKKVLAYETTKITHGTEIANESREASEKAFGGNIFEAELPTIILNNDAKNKIYGKELNIIDILLIGEMVKSKSEARRLIKQGGAYINEERVIDENAIITEDYIKGNSIILRTGKKNYKKIII